MTQHQMMTALDNIHEHIGQLHDDEVLESEFFAHLSTSVRRVNDAIRRRERQALSWYREQQLRETTE